MDPKEVDQIIYSILLSRQTRTRPLRSYLPIPKIRKLLDAAQSVLAKDPILLEIPGNVHVVGDIHGNIDDLIRIFDKCGFPPDQSYLFLGDYVDRGKHGLEVILLLFALKIKYPTHMFLLRGNHEISRISEFYGFLDEVEIKYTASLFYSVQSVFEQLPICCVILESIICMHGGIGPHFEYLSQLRDQEKPADISTSGMFEDILWSDPREEVATYAQSYRNCGCYFGRNALKQFLNNNELDLMIRSHELCEDGINQPIMSEDGKTPLCLTVFSNTDYCQRNNKACVCNISNDLIITIDTFEPMSVMERIQYNITFPKWLSYLMEEEINALQADSEPNSEVDIISHDMKSGINIASALVLCE